MLALEVDDMKIGELCKASGATKKAVTYAIDQGMLAPAELENGYRDFTEDDVRRMQRITALRALGLNTADVRAALAGEWGAALASAAVQAELTRSRQEILTRLACDGDWTAARRDIDRVMRTLPLTQRLKAVFPGAFGTFVAAHFAPYLTEPLVTADQQAAWDAAIAWLDGAAFSVPDELEELYAAFSMQSADASVYAERMEAALADQRAYIAAHREEIEAYRAFKSSAAYQTTDAARVEKLLREFLAQSGYNDVFIPLMRRLSPKYNAYQMRLQAANASFLAAMSENTEEAP